MRFQFTAVRGSWPLQLVGPNTETRMSCKMYVCINEFKGQRERKPFVCMYVYTYIYIYMYVCWPMFIGSQMTIDKRLQ